MSNNDSCEDKPTNVWGNNNNNNHNDTEKPAENPKAGLVSAESDHLPKQR